MHQLLKKAVTVLALLAIVGLTVTVESPAASAAPSRPAAVHVASSCLVTQGSISVDTPWIHVTSGGTRQAYTVATANCGDYTNEYFVALYRNGKQVYQASWYGPGVGSALINCTGTSHTYFGEIRAYLNTGGSVLYLYMTRSNSITLAC